MEWFEQLTGFRGLTGAAAGEATLWAAVLNAQWGASRQVPLTQLGGGAAGKDPAWIRTDLQHAWQNLKGQGPMSGLWASADRGLNCCAGPQA